MKVLHGRRLIVLDRPTKRKDGKIRNYQLQMWVEVIDYARVGIHEFLCTDQNVVFKRVYTQYDSSEGWKPCPELCGINRGNGYLFNQTVSLIEKDKENAHV